MDITLRENLEVVRLPLYSSDENRVSTHRQVASANSQTQPRDQLLVNMFPAVYKDPIRPDGPKVALVSRPGFASPSANATYTTAGTYPTYGTDTFQSIIASVCFQNLNDVNVIALYDALGDFVYINQYRITAGTIVNLEKIDVSTYSYPNVHISELVINGTIYVGVVVSDVTYGGPSKAYYQASASGVFAENGMSAISDADFPTEQTPAKKIVGPLVQMDGYTFVFTEDGYIYNSDLNSITSWDTQGYIKAASKEDRGMSLARYKHHIVAFSESSIEFFNNEGNAAPESPLDRTSQAFIGFGTHSQHAILPIDDTIYWIAKSSTGTTGLWKLDGYTPQLISSNYLNTYIQSSDSTQPYLQAITMRGMRHLITNIRVMVPTKWLPSTQSGDVTPENTDVYGYWTYCLDTNAWWILSYSFNIGSPILVNRNAGYTGSYKGATIVWCGGGVQGVDMFGIHPQVLTDGYELHTHQATPSSTRYNNFDATRDGNAATIVYWRIPCVILTNTFDFETESRKFIKRIKLIADKIEWSTSTGSEPFTSLRAQGLPLYLAATRIENATNDPAEWNIRKLDIVEKTTFTDYFKDRYYWNNFGAGRQWKFGIFISTWVPLRFEALEVTIGKGTH